MMSKKTCNATRCMQETDGTEKNPTKTPAHLFWPFLLLLFCMLIYPIRVPSLFIVYIWNICFSPLL